MLFFQKKALSVFSGNGVLYRNTPTKSGQNIMKKYMFFIYDYGFQWKRGMIPAKSYALFFGNRAGILLKWQHFPGHSAYGRKSKRINKRSLFLRTLKRRYYTDKANGVYKVME